MVPVAGRYDDGSATTSSLRPDGAGSGVPTRRCDPARMVQDEVAAEIVLDDGGLTGHGRRTVLRLIWDPADPLAVQLDVHAEPDHPALPRGEWVILRDFLRYGLEEPTGDGEVRIRPDEQLDRVWLELERPGRAACVSVSRDVVRSFLDRTDAIVPTGEEGGAAALDALLERLLDAD